MQLSTIVSWATPIICLGCLHDIILELSNPVLK